MAADSEEFTTIASVLVRTTTLSDMQAKGLVRRLLTQAGLKAQDVTAFQLAAVGRTLLADALRKNGVDDPEHPVAEWQASCEKMVERAKTAERGRVTNTVDAVFSRMGFRR